jgi:hypothetical protein
VGFDDRAAQDDFTPEDRRASVRNQGWMGATHFLMRGRRKVATEMALNVLAYNIKRVIAILGCRPLLQAMQT